MSENPAFKDKHHSVVGALLGQEVEVEFVSLEEALALHEQIVERFGGAAGVRDKTLLDSALYRPMQAATYAGIGLMEAAALLAEAIIRNHPFIDGNKRTGYFCLVTMLAKNGYDFRPDPAEALYMIKAMAAGQMDEQAFAAWVSRAAVPIRAADDDPADQANNVARPRPRG